MIFRWNCSYFIKKSSILIFLQLRSLVNHIFKLVLIYFTCFYVHFTVVYTDFFKLNVSWKEIIYFYVFQRRWVFLFFNISWWILLGKSCLFFPRGTYWVWRFLLVVWWVLLIKIYLFVIYVVCYNWLLHIWFVKTL
jgi:hypothetical protein